MPKRRHKKTFPCGHTGFGSFCRPCREQEQARQEVRAQRERERQQQRAWRQTFDNDPIDLRMLPNRSLVERARTIIAALAQGEDYRKFRGKALVGSKDVITVPLGYSYRLLCRKTPAGFEPIQCDSHETYNKKRYA